MTPKQDTTRWLLRRDPPASALLVIAALALLVIGSCAGTSNLPEDIRVLETSAEGLSPAAATLLEEAKRHARTRLTSAALGGTAGLLAGLYPARTAGSGSGAAAVYAAAGGVGSALGYAYGEYVAARSARAVMDQEKVRLLAAAAQKDAQAYQHSLSLARQVVDESEAVVEQAPRAPATVPERHVANRRQARNLDATAAALRQALKEIEGNLEVMQIDLQEVQDVEVIKRFSLDADELRRQALALQDTHTGMTAQVRRAEQLAQVIPPEERAAPPF